MIVLFSIYNQKSMCIKKARTKLCHICFEVFDYPSRKYKSKAHAYGVSVIALLLRDLKVSKFQNKIKLKRFFQYVHDAHTWGARFIS